MRLTEKNIVNKLEDCINGMKYGLIITPSKITMAIELIKEVAHERDLLLDLVRRLEALPDCNNCGDKNRCSYVPRAGENTRINCPLWRENKK